MDKNFVKQLVAHGKALQAIHKERDREIAESRHQYELEYKVDGGEWQRLKTTPRPTPGVPRK